VNRAHKLRTSKIDPSVDTMLKITGDGRKAAFDMRLVDPFAQPGDTKVASMANRRVSYPTPAGALHEAASLPDAILRNLPEKTMRMSEEEIATHYIHNVRAPEPAKASESSCSHHVPPPSGPEGQWHH
jgi:hypothetical protein